MTSCHHQAPLGGTREQGSHKGYGFALMAEVLSTMLAGALPTMLAPGSGFQEPLRGVQHRGLHRPRAVQDLDGRHAPDPTDGAAGAPGEERVLYPGLSEAEEIVHRRAHGIPLHKEVLTWFAECARDLGLAPLAPMR